jgi:hypothetical protein
MPTIRTGCPSASRSVAFPLMLRTDTTRRARRSRSFDQMRTNLATDRARFYAELSGLICGTKRDAPRYPRDCIAPSGCRRWR